MRIFYSALLIFAFAFSTMLAQPKLEIEGGTTYDWGRVTPEQNPLKASIKLHNKGDKTLEIKRVKPGCGCTTAPLDTNIIAPGKYATLEVTLNVSTYDGPVTKSISIFTNQPEERTMLMIKANVMRPITVFPKFLSFPKLFINEESVGKVVITNNTDKPVTVTGVDVSARVIAGATDGEATMKVNVKVGDVLNPKVPYTVEATLMPKSTGRLSSSVKIKTDSKESGLIEISGWGNIVDPKEEPKTGQNR
ncbi:MAG: DUF1573 domain-containing protein [Candidatus Kapabacteria bacterium]|jgi:hypothetical protein|nr:DUF1573 domain-containing protein [Candidatus Kapabacteria bacterium]